VATKTLSSPIFYGGIYLEVFRERKMDWPTSNSMVGFQSAGTAIDQPMEVIQKLLYHHLMYFTRMCEVCGGLADWWTI